MVDRLMNSDGWFFITFIKTLFHNVQLVDESRPELLKEREREREKEKKRGLMVFFLAAW
jgi:hypothetical protein